MDSLWVCQSKVQPDEHCHKIPMELLKHVHVLSTIEPNNLHTSQLQKYHNVSEKYVLFA